MAHSLAQATELTCPHCGQTFTADLWLVVDTAERPELLDQIRAGTLHTQPCPHCGRAATADAPLLLVRPGEEPPLLFSPARNTSAEQDREQKAELMDALRQRMGSAWQHAWVAQGLPGMSRARLAAALSDDPQVACQAREAAALSRVMQQFIQAGTWSESRRIAEQHPELLTDAADALLGRLMSAAREGGDERAERAFRGHRDLLRRCREAGVEAAIQQKTGTGRESRGAIPEEFQVDFRRAEEAEQRYHRTGDESGLDKAAAAWERILSHPAFAAAETGFQLAALNNASVVFLRRYSTGGRVEELNRALAGWREAVQCSLPDSPDLPSLLNNLGNGLRTRYARTSQTEDLEEAIRVYQQAIRLTPPDSPDLPSLLSNLGNGLRTRYARTGQTEDLEEAIRVYREAVRLTPPDSPDLLGYVNNLGNGLSTRYERTGRIEDLEEAIRRYQQAVRLTPPDSPDLPSLLSNLGNGLSTRHERAGRMEDLEEAVRVSQQAVRLTPPDSPDLPGRLNNLGLGLSTRYDCIGRMEDLEEAIRVYQQAVRLTPPGSPGLLGRLSNLGNGLSTRYAHTGRMEDLEEAVRVYQQAVRLTPPHSPDLPSLLNNLGNGLSTRYAHSGRMEDLEEAIRVYQQAVRLTPPHSPDLPGRLNNLGIGLNTRYERTGRLEDLEEAIHVYQQAVRLTPPDSPDLPCYVNNLGTGLSTCYDRTGHMEDLEEAICVYQQAVRLTPPHSPDLPGYLNNLGNGLRTRYERAGRIEDLEEAIRAYQQAARLTSPHSPDLPRYLNNLGNGQGTRYDRTGRIEDLEEAISVYRRAVRLTPPDSPDLPSLLNNLGNGLSTRYNRAGRRKDLKEAICVYKKALRVFTPAAWPRRSRDVHRQLGSALFARQDWEAAHSAFAQARELTEAFYAGALLQTEREQESGANARMYAEDAFCLAKTGDLHSAWIALETNRARALREGRDRSRARQVLASSPPEVQDHYADLAGREHGLTAAMSRPEGDPAHRPLAELYQEMASLTAERRTFEADLLKAAGIEVGIPAPPSLQALGLLQDPRTGLLSLAVTGQGTLALLLTRAGLEQAVIPDLTDTDLRTLVQGPDEEPEWGGWLGATFGQRRAYNDWRLAAVRAFLSPSEPLLHEREEARIASRAASRHWQETIQETLAALGARMWPAVDALLQRAGVEQVVLVPHGALFLLPLHACPLGKGCAADRYTIAYAPSCAVLAQLVTGQDRGLERALVVANPTGDLPYSPSEALAVADILDGAVTLWEEEATRARILATACDANLLHFSGHGVYDWSDPDQSGLVLASGGDGAGPREPEVLTVAEIRERLSLEQMRLVTLSACDTGLAEVRRGLADEYLSLAGILLQAGARAVVASLWPVDDLATALLVRQFYRLWQRGQVPVATALQRAQRWLRTRTRHQVQEALDELDALWERWREPDADAAMQWRAGQQDWDIRQAHRSLSAMPDPPFGQPYWWAAFQAVGDVL